MPVDRQGNWLTTTDDIAGRILAWATALRDWSLANPQGFRLIYGDPVPGYQSPEGGPAPEAAKRACLGLTGLAAAAWPYAKTTQGGDHAWEDFAPELVDTVRRDNPDMPPAGLALALCLWGHMHGLVALEVYGHLGPQSLRPDELYHAEIRDLIRSLRLPASSDDSTLST
ncbi:TetR-like C-terminal domain-containing protein [Streptomyces sp. RLB1-33]|nr:TetR/AcrR family transcriptional regulator [Streptomyces sp. RLB1-33]